jgi:hypothetical protein
MKRTNPWETLIIITTITKEKASELKAAGYDTIK